jgi:hypothetical protein
MIYFIKNLRRYSKNCEKLDNLRNLHNQIKALKKQIAINQRIIDLQNSFIKLNQKKIDLSQEIFNRINIKILTK